MAVTNKDVCKACTDLNSYVPELQTHGITDSMYNTLKANQGLLNKGRDNCTDIQMANDCLIAGLAEKAQSYDKCYPNKMFEDLAKNLTIVLDMIGAGDCGQWEEIKALWDEINKIWESIKELQDSVSGNGGNITKLMNALTKILENLKSSGAWTSEGDILEGSFAPNRIIASGNINIFGGTPDGDYAIRTSNSPCENDLCGGI